MCSGTYFFKKRTASIKAYHWIHRVPDNCWTPWQLTAPESIIWLLNLTHGLLKCNTGVYHKKCEVTRIKVLLVSFQFIFMHTLNNFTHSMIDLLAYFGTLYVNIYYYKYMWPQHFCTRTIMVRCEDVWTFLSVDTINQSWLLIHGILWQIFMSVVWSLDNL
jgi:hypothetical protein